MIRCVHRRRRSSAGSASDLGVKSLLYASFKLEGLPPESMGDPCQVALNTISPEVGKSVFGWGEKSQPHFSLMFTHVDLLFLFSNSDEASGSAPHSYTQRYCPFDFLTAAPCSRPLIHSLFPTTRFHQLPYFFVSPLLTPLSWPQRLPNSSFSTLHVCQCVGTTCQSEELDGLIRGGVVACHPAPNTRNQNLLAWRKAREHHSLISTSVSLT